MQVLRQVLATLERQQLDGHAQCIAGEPFKTGAAALLARAEVTFQAVAGALGVSLSTVRAWYVAARF